MRCPTCDARPARRACPALDRHICSPCCGTKRRVEISCPESCAYLASSRAHPPVFQIRQQEQDMAILMPGMVGLTETQQRLFLLSLTLLHRFRGEGLDAARDVDVAEAAGSLALTYETESKGVIYEHRAGSLPAQRLAGELRSIFDELGRSTPSAFLRDAATVLRQLQTLAQSVERMTPADPCVFLDLVGRVASRIVGPGGADAGADIAEA
jgi:hypothetical protein